MLPGGERLADETAVALAQDVIEAFKWMHHHILRLFAPGPQGTPFA